MPVGRLLLWRGSLLPLGCGAAPISSPRSIRKSSKQVSGAASRPSGSKLPRHSKPFCQNEPLRQIRVQTASPACARSCDRCRR
ncbi:hypothetical protein DCC84_02875 [Pseudomonas sp. SXM-1]|nr:hypothetical protein DCC84_02875 [Pseudomonas sp. SXM-1]